MVSNLSARAIVEAIAAAAGSWSDRNDDRRRAACRQVAERTGYAAAAVETAFDRLFSPLHAEAIEAAIASELGSLDVLDAFVERGSGRVRALPIGRVCVVSSRTTIGVALMPAIFAMCAGCDVLVKDREDRLVALFFQTLCEVQPELTRRIAAAAWRGSDDAVDLSHFDAVVAFGSTDTLTTIARSLPLRTRFIPYGSAMSAGYVGAADLGTEAHAGTLARSASRDALLYDGEGCMSLHVLFVESGGRISPDAFAELLRDAFAKTARRYPASLQPAVSARTALRRDDVMLGAVCGHFFSDEHASYLLFAAENRDSPPLLAPRAMTLVPVQKPHDAAEYLHRHGLAPEVLAVSGAGRDYTEFAVSCGAARVTSFGAMQAPPVGSPHGGRPRIAEFVRWIADET